MMTNIERFSVVPMMDSLMLTHSPSYPPPQQYIPDTIFSVIRARIDDSSNPLLNLRYYIPPAAPGQTNPDQLGFWINERQTDYYQFWDADNGANQKLYYENNSAQDIDLNTWDTELFGDLNYYWKVIHDIRQGTFEVNYSNVIDTSQYWGRNWRAEVTTPFNWSQPRSFPYMRLLTISEAENINNGYTLQADTSASEKTAHKVIFSYNTWATNLDIVDWAITHIGVPYAIKDGTTKLPYEKIDCAGLVTATKIQEIWECGNPGLAVGPIISLNYYNGDYGNLHLTDRIDRPPDDEDFVRQAGRGFLLFIHKQGDVSPAWKDSRHIMIVYYSTYDSLTNMPSRCWVVHAPGHPLDRVRYDNALARYRPYDLENPSPDHYIWTILKWAF